MAPRDEEKESYTGLLIALGAVGAILVVGLVALKLHTSTPPAARPPEPVRPPTITETLRTSANFYKANLDEAARRFGLPPVGVDEIGQPLHDFVELDAPRTLAPGQSFETAHLTLRAEAVPEWSGSGGRGFRSEHLVLAITNRTERPLAYRVDTAVDDPQACRNKGVIAQNAIAIGPREEVRRTECVYRRGGHLTLTHVEAIELLPLEYRYVSRLVPDQVGLDPRTSAGHTVDKGKPCQFIPWREIQAGGAGWADVIDFYARHDCDEYTFFRSYRFRSEPGPLPAVAASPVDGGATD